MPNTDQFGAPGVAERLCELVRDVRLRRAGNDAEGTMTVSIGVATVPPGDPASGFDGVERPLSAADTALYRAKDAGRNRVAVAARGPTPQPGAREERVGSGSPVLLVELRHEQ